MKIFIPLRFLFCMIILSHLFIDINAQQSSTAKIFGVGYGVFIIGFGAVIGILLCLFAKVTSIPGIMITLGFAIPIILLIIFLASPKQSQKPQTAVGSGEVDNFFIPRYLCLGVFILGFLASIFCLFSLKCLRYLMAYRVDSQASVNEKKLKSQLTKFEIQHEINPNAPINTDNDPTNQPARYSPAENETGKIGDLEEGSALLNKQGK